MNGAISVEGCVQVSIDAFMDEMNGENILAQNENLVNNVLVEAQPSIVDLKNPVNSCPGKTDLYDRGAKLR